MNIIYTVTSNNLTKDIFITNLKTKPKTAQ